VGRFYGKKGNISMANINNNSLKLAVQKQGRLTEETLDFLRQSGLIFESYQQRLFSTCRNFPLEILFVRDDDIPDYVASGTVDLGIVGQNILQEKQQNVTKLFNLRYGYCSLIVAVPKESTIQLLADLQGKTIATSYPLATKKYFQENNVPVTIVPISGSVEITPALGIAQAIVDLTSSGSTLALHDLKILTKVFDSEALLIANEQTFVNGKKDVCNKLLNRFKAVLSARDYKYIMMNVPEKVVTSIQQIVPGLQAPTVSPLTKKGWFSLQTVVKEDMFWETIEKLKQIGASGIIVLPIEKMIV
jgi:ATP phosphoribosyltransferase